MDASSLSVFNAGGTLEVGDPASGTGAVDLRAWDWSGKGHHVVVAGGSLTVSGDQVLAANRNLTLIARNMQDLTLNGTVSPGSGAGQVNLLSTRHIHANRNIQHPGSGAVNLVAGWDGSTGYSLGSFGIAALLGNANSYGNGGGSVFINGSFGSTGVAVGSANGQTGIAASALTLRGSDSVNQGWAQLGCHSSAHPSCSGDIMIRLKAALGLIGGSRNDGFALIGHGGQYTNTNRSGNISVVAGGSATLLAGGDGNAFARIGHGGRDTDGTATGNISLTVGGDLLLENGGSWGTHVAVGHGGEEINSSLLSGDITVTATGNITVIGATNDSDTQIGHARGWNGGGSDSNGDITVTAGGNLTLQARGGWSPVAIGHGNWDPGSFNGNINVLAQDITLSSGWGAAEWAHIGHGMLDWGGGGLRQGNILVGATGELSLVGTASREAYIGHISSDGSSALSNANVRIVAGSLDFAGGAASGTFNLNNTSFRDRMVANLAGGDVTIASAGQPVTIGTAWNATSGSSRNLNILSFGDLAVNQSITHSGNGGRVNLFAGWDGTSGLAADGSLDLATLALRDVTDTGVLALASGAVVTAGATGGTGIIAAAADRFTNNNASGGLVVAGGSRYLVYSTSAAVTALGTLAPGVRTGIYAARRPADLPAGNWVVYDPGLLMLLVGGQSYAYNGTAQLVGSAGAAGYGTLWGLDAASLSLLGADGYTVGAFTASLGGSAGFSVVGGDGTTATVGRDIVGSVGTLASSLGYDLAFDNTPTGELVISPRAITAITGLTGVNKVYDATTAATLNTGSAAFTGMVAGDVLTVGSYTASFLDANAGTAKTVNISGLTLGGASAGNYTLAGTTASTTANITARAITAITGLTGVNKVYDATTAATISTAGAGFTGMVGGDTLTVGSYSASFVDANVGTAKTVNISGLTLGGASAGNYTLTGTTATTTADITAKAITAITGLVGVNKVYDATTAATINTGSAGFTGMIAGDTLTVGGYSASFADANAGTAKTVNISGLTLGGASAGNYTLAGTTASTTASITARPLVVRGADGGKVYGDGDPALAWQLVSGSLVGGDGFSGALARVAGEGAGSHAILQGSLGAGSNYALTYIPGTFTIARAPVVLAVLDAARRAGGANPAFGFRLEGLRGGDGAAVFSGIILAAAADAGSPAGRYAITASGGTAQNYAITRWVPGTLTVLPAAAAPSPLPPPPAAPPVAAPSPLPSLPVAPAVPVRVAEGGMVAAGFGMPRAPAVPVTPVEAVYGMTPGSRVVTDPYRERYALGTVDPALELRLLGEEEASGVRRGSRSAFTTFVTDLWAFLAKRP